MASWRALRIVLRFRQERVIKPQRLAGAAEESLPLFNVAGHLARPDDVGKHLPLVERSALITGWRIGCVVEHLADERGIDSVIADVAALARDVLADEPVVMLDLGLIADGAAAVAASPASRRARFMWRRGQLSRRRFTRASRICRSEAVICLGRRDFPAFDLDVIEATLDRLRRVE